MDAEVATERLRSVDDPRLGDDLVSLGLVNDIRVDADTVRISLALGAPYSPVETALADMVRDVFAETGYNLELSAALDRAGPVVDSESADVKNVIAIMSGKGGVGKSTVAANTAVTMARRGARVGLFDADFYGPNLPRMLGVKGVPVGVNDDALFPVRTRGVELMSMGLLTGDDGPVIWRGAMVTDVFTNLWHDISWGTLDYLIVDLPPGTGDTQLTMLQQVPVTGAVIVTTPQETALDDARRGLRLFEEHNTPVLGIVENMSGFLCPDCGNEHPIFDADGGQGLAAEFGLPLLGAIPLDPAIGALGDASDEGDDTDTSPHEAFDAVAANVMDELGEVLRRRHVDRRDESVV
ncbi:Mrp/NBP35 family ATP-binding protein [Halococcus thailandensis]|uniref:Iron-sulfur cluster carrier protein n=1 Tax=Halococcus thailandensis JCM 13552 TaxID=1227457 RepID=M0NE20_9EURY|nr:Mrp/NBP35 family ATP-binding protein [Halococcus thailandensis]EMA56076.1 ATP-binding protein Mrp 1 [Halococcus thailandensis JCM 13552]